MSDVLDRLSDADLVRAAGRGEPDAFRQLYERKHHRVQRIAYQMLGDRGAAEDVTQEAFVALWRNCRRYRTRFAVDAWLTRIATNKAIDRWRNDRRHPIPLGERPGATGTERQSTARSVAPAGVTTETAAQLLPADHLADPSLAIRWEEVQRIWNEFAAELPERQRAAFVLREIEDLPVRDVAAALGCSTSTVRSHVALARRELRHGIRTRYPEYAAVVADDHD